MRLLAHTPSVRARNLEKHLRWSDLLAPVVAERLRGEGQVPQGGVRRFVA